MLNRSSRTHSDCQAASADLADRVDSNSSKPQEVRPLKNALQQSRLPRVLHDGTIVERTGPGVMLPPQPWAVYPRMDCGMAWNESLSHTDLIYPAPYFTPMNPEHGRSNAEGRVTKPRQHKSIDPPKAKTKEVIDLTQDSPNDDLNSNTLQRETISKPRHSAGEFATPTSGEQTVFLLCSLRLDAAYDGPPAVLEELLSLTLQAMGQFGRACLDGNPATRGCTFHVCRDINCERHCRR